MMFYYVISSDNKCIAVCDNQPDAEDLDSRGERVIESQDRYSIGCLYEDGTFKLQEETNSEKLSAFLGSVSSSISYVNSIGLQCYMLGARFPDDWVDYRAKLVARSTTTAWDDSLSLPVQPDVPPGVIV